MSSHQRRHHCSPRRTTARCLLAVYALLSSCAICIHSFLDSAYCRRPFARMIGRNRALARRAAWTMVQSRSQTIGSILSVSPSALCLGPWTGYHGRCVARSRRRTDLFSTVSLMNSTATFDVRDDTEAAVERDDDRRTTSSSAVSSSLGMREASAQEPPVPSGVEARLEAAGIRSRPKPDGKGVWRPDDPDWWYKDFGSRSIDYWKRIEPLIRLQPGDEGYFDVTGIKVPMVTIVRTVQDARTVMERLMNADESLFHACDTEVMDLDLKTVGPVGNGYVTCVSIYAGKDFDYGLGDGPGTVLWIDNLDDACGVLQEFKPWFEDERFKKVWHNYGFDRHVMWNEGIDCRGFGGDTMHMARLQDSSRSREGNGNGYSLEALTDELLNCRKRPMKEIFGIKRLRKDGSEGSILDLPPVEVMQRDPAFRSRWIEYSCYDAQGTYQIHEKLRELLTSISWLSDDEGKMRHNLYEYYWQHMRPFGEVLTDMERRGIRVDARDYLASVELQAREDRARHSKVFRDWAATTIGPDGLALNPASSLQLCTFLFGGAKNSKTGSNTESVRVFKVPCEDIPEDALEAFRLRDEAEAADSASDNRKGTANELDYLDKMKQAQLKELCKQFGLKVSGKKADLQARLREHLLQQATDGVGKVDDGLELMSVDELRDAINSRGVVPAGVTHEELLKEYREDVAYVEQIKAAVVAADHGSSAEAISRVLEREARRGGSVSSVLQEVKELSEQAPKFINVRIPSLGLEPTKATAGGAPSVTADVLKKLAGDPFSDPPQYGTAFKRVGREGCIALHSLFAIGSIDTMIANFLTSLQELADSDSRVHCSLNLNTETGRLSSRRPNLQNQPALEKDKYKIRKAFQASPGNNLIVADYGQLELRILASITDCQSMIEAFASGGDFHSRTAIDMFPYVREAVENGECLLEWDYSSGQGPPKPLLKDKYAAERRKAKTLNFSIAYGKTAHGLSQDWGVSTEEAENMLAAWYAARPEVNDWQLETKGIAKKDGITRTLMGRYRQLPDAQGGKNRKLLGHALRASINTPIQGGAADIAMMAMNKINASAKLRSLGWILLLQIHDEVILEGPEETAEEAFEEVVRCMEQPWVFGLDPTAVPLAVDGSYTHKTWYDAK